MTILEALREPELFEPHFKKPETWAAWFAVLAALFGLPMSAEDLALYQQCTGRQDAPTEAFKETWLVVGRRGGKSRVLALIAVYLGCFREYAEFLSPGERATVMVIAADRRQARTIFRYARALIKLTPLLAPMLERETADELELTNGVTIEIGTASHRTSRGYTFAAVLCDEVAFWPTDDSAEPDYAILDAIRPGMATIPSAMLLGASSPYAQRGALYDAHREHFGQDGSDVLVWKAATRVMNPAIDPKIITRAYERDPEAADAEYGANFRTDVQGYVRREVVEAVTSTGVFERPFVAGKRYVAFVDPSGGSADSMTLAIAHLEGKVAMLDAVRERKAPFSPESVVDEFAKTLRAYGIRKVTGDRYAGEWPREAFRRHQITYDPADSTKSQLYQALLPKLNSREVNLLNDPQLAAQLLGLERRTARGGRDSIDHRPGSHDDVANAVAGALNAAAAGPTATGASREFLF